MTSIVADNVSRRATPLSANSTRNPLCLRARAPMTASGYNYPVIFVSFQSGAVGNKPYNTILDGHVLRATPVT